jgi:nucleotide-binding universal stress UspA family protein
VSPTHDHRQPRILIAYDSSADAESALELAAAAFAGARATVLTVWEPSMVDALRHARGGRPPLQAVGPDRVGERPERVAYAIARRGAQRARRLGLEAEARSDLAVTDIWRAIVDAADDEHADLIIAGRHGLAGPGSSEAGSVAQSVVRHADRPVLVVPPAPAAEPRRAAAAAHAAVDGALRSGASPNGAVPTGGLRLQVVPLEEV